VNGKGHAENGNGLSHAKPQKTQRTATDNDRNDTGFIAQSRKEQQRKVEGLRTARRITQPYRSHPLPFFFFSCSLRLCGFA